MKTDIQKKFDKEFANKEITTDNWTEFAEKENASIADVLSKEELRDLRKMIKDKNSGLSVEDKLILCSLFNIPLSLELIGAKFGMSATGAKKFIDRTVDKMKKSAKKVGLSKNDLDDGRNAKRDFADDL